MKKFFLLLLIFTNICLGQSFSSIYNFSSVNTTSGTTDLTPVPTSNGVTFGSFTSTGVSINPNATGRFSFTGWDLGATNASNIFTGSINLNKYYQVTITPQPGYNIDINSISFTIQRSGTGIRQYVVRSSLDNYTNNLPASISTTNTNLSVLSTNIFQIADPTTAANNGSLITLDSNYNIISSPITFRFYGFNAEAAGGTFSIDNVIFNGVATTCSGGSTIWSGSWSNGLPNSNTAVIVDADYNTITSGNIDACTVTVNAGKTLTVGSNQYVNIQNELINNGIVNINDGSLVQVNNVSNTGSVNYNRNVNSLRGYDYVYWSSPVSNQTLASLYTIPTMGFSYQWNPTFNNTNGTQGNWVAPTTTMTPAKGYIIRASSSYGWLGNLTANYTGVPNNGDISIPIERGSLLGQNDNWNLVGNPYPSSINIVDFLTTNTSIDGYVSLWLHSNEPVSSTSPFYQNFQYNYSNDYLIVNGTGASNTSTTPYYISSGQGFFVSMLESSSDYSTLTSTLNFTNSLRNKTYDNSIFYRQSVEEQGKIWIDLLDQSNNATRTLIGYVESATNQRDRLYDALTTESKIYSLIDNQKFIIQGRSLPFDQNDQVSLGIKISTSGNYKIAVADIIGILSSQDVYLQDTYLNVIHDLRQSPYIFNSSTGTFNDRFILRYTNNSLSNPDFTNTNFILYVKDDLISVKSNSIIQEVKVYNILGELLYENKFNDNLVSFDINTNSQILFVKIKTNDIYLTKKIIK